VLVIWYHDEGELENGGLSLPVIRVDDDEADFGLVQRVVAAGVDQAIIFLERVVDALLQSDN
jgi:hypothetical protein